MDQQDVAFVYPLKECEDCLHNEVCKYLELFAEIRDIGELPLDFDNAACTCYLSESAIGDYEDDTYDAVAKSVAATLKTLIEGAVAAGQKPISILMNAFTNRVLAYEMGSNSSELITKLSVNGLILSVIVDKDIEDMVIKVEYEDGDNCVG